MTPPINSVSDHILQGIAAGDLAASPFEVVSIAKELAARRAANTPVGGVEITDRMVGIALTEFNAKTHTYHTEAMRAALTKAYAASPALPSQVVGEQVAENANCLTSPAAEPVEAVELMVTELLDTSKVADPQMRKRAAFMLMRLYTHPAPSASREVTVTDEMVLRSCQSEYPALFRHGLTPPEGSGLNSRKQMETITERHRSALNAALLAALPEREG